WNDAVEVGWYEGHNAANAPAAGVGIRFLVVVEAFADSWVTQTAHQVASSDGASDTKTYRRSKDNGVWQSWYRLRLSEAEQGALYATLAGDQTISSLK